MAFVLSIFRVNLIDFNNYQMVKYLILTFCLSFVYTNFCLADRIDSIKAVINSLEGDDKLEALYKFSFETNVSDPDFSKELSTDLLRLSGKDHYRYKALAYYNIGEVCFYKELYNESLSNYLNAQPYLVLASDSVMISANYSNIGLINYYKSNYSIAIENYENSLDIDIALNDSLGIAKTYQNMGLVFGDWGNTDLRTSYFKKALEIYEKIGDKTLIADINLNLGVTFSQNDSYKAANRYYKSALEAYNELNDSDRIGSVLNNIGCNYFKMGKYDVATDYLKKAVGIFDLIENKSGLVHALSGLGDVYAAKGYNDKAIRLYKKCEDVNKDVGLIETQMNNLYSLYDTYKESKHFEDAIRVLEEYYQIKDSLFAENQTNKMLELESKYIYQKTQNQLTELTAKNRLYLIVITIIIFVAILGIAYWIFYFRTKRLEEKQRLLRLEQKVLRTQMNPHFIFNSLSAIQCYVLDNKVEDAVDFLADFAGLMRMVLQYSQEEFITLAQEREILDYYINLQNRRFGGKINYQILVDEKLDNTKTMIPPMLAQPFIENSFEHGELFKRKDGNITVSFKKQDKVLAYCIEDNGIGVDFTNDNKVKDVKKHKSLALKITRERLNLINHKHKNGRVGLMIEDRKNAGAQGTKVVFTIPLVEFY